ncbi:MAG: FHA domain-containing protein [Solobacterium sp.]|nr:FHA domain-containing protein [Solobacterium sp.]
MRRFKLDMISRPDGKIECPVCHAYFTPDADYCPCCGRELKEDYIPEPPKGPYIKRESDGSVTEIKGDYFRIGKSARQCDMVIEHGSVSGIHIDLLRKDGKWYVYDLRSTNGTWLDGVRIPPRVDTEIHDGCELTLGREVIYFYTGE